MSEEDTVPATLWHYTDVHGLFGIVASSKLRLGDVRFLNDRTEGTYAEGVLRQVFEEEAADNSDGACENFRNRLRALTSRDGLYVASFSEVKESISQWQRYGAEGAGYCIGFETKALDALMHYDDIHRVSMIYDLSDQKELLRNIVCEGMAWCRQYPDVWWDGAERSTEVAFTVIKMLSALLRLKNPAFRDEQEWRYVKTMPEAEINDANFRDEDYAVRGTYLKPYIQYPRPPDEYRWDEAAPATTLPIVAVACGPRMDGDLSVASVRGFLKRYSYRADVEHSAYRDIWR